MISNAAIRRGLDGEGGLAPVVHLIAGLPTDEVVRGFDRIREHLPVSSLACLVASSSPECARTGVLLPPHAENSQVVEDWETCDFLERRFGPGARIGGVLTVVDADALGDQLESADPISALGWGRSARDARTVADIVAGQVESATHLLLVGRPSSCASVRGLLEALNPDGALMHLDGAASQELLEVTQAPPGRSESARVVPPWLALLRAERVSPDRSDRFLYRRSLPFDAQRFGEWLADPPRSLVRGKGNVWLANRLDQSMGYSCAGSVHRLFDAGRWWASQSGSAWPTCESARRRLLERWHPQFGDRRQELAFVGLDLDVERVRAELDACLLSETEALESFEAATPSLRVTSHPGHSGAGLH